MLPRLFKLILRFPILCMIDAPSGKGYKIKGNFVYALYSRN